jgi:hypothetical protein
MSYNVVKLGHQAPGRNIVGLDGLPLEAIRTQRQLLHRMRRACESEDEIFRAP